MKNYQKLLLVIVTPALLLVWSPSAAAVTPPDDCFDIDVGTQTILDYFEYQDNNPANPACPLDVDIPSVISSTPITSIGYGAFADKGLTSVTIPNSVISIAEDVFMFNELTTISIPASVTEIQPGTFMGNQLTSVTLPGTMQTISPNAFAGNRLQSIYVPSSVTTIYPFAFWLQNPLGGDLLEPIFLGDPIGLEDVWYTRLYTEDPSNPAGLVDSIDLESGIGLDVNDDGDTDDSVGGYLINPSSITVNYQNSTGGSLQPSQAITGTGLSTYLVADNPTNDPGLYYRLGQTQNLSAPAIAGYDTITPASPFSLLLAAAENVHTFVYSSSDDGVDGSGTAGSGSGGTLAESGQGVLVGVSALSLSGAGVTALRRRQYGYAAKR